MKPPREITEPIRWRRVEDGEPEECDVVFAFGFAQFDSKPTPHPAWLEDGVWRACALDGADTQTMHSVTHWAPWPRGPEGGRE